MYAITARALHHHSESFSRRVSAWIGDMPGATWDEPVPLADMLAAMRRIGLTCRDLWETVILADRDLAHRLVCDAIAATVPGWVPPGPAPVIGVSGAPAADDAGRWFSERSRLAAAGHPLAAAAAEDIAEGMHHIRGIAALGALAI